MATLTIKGCRPAQPPVIFLRRWPAIKPTRPQPEPASYLDREALTAAALAYLGGGLSIIPVNAKKKPAITRWKPYQKKQATRAQVKRWERLYLLAGFAVVCGGVSGGLTILDFDVAGFYERWAALAGELAQTLPTQRTGSGGYQVAFRSNLKTSNDKLAYSPGREIAVETRGEGGYAVLPPSFCHLAEKRGKRHQHPYKVIQGDFGAIPTITDEQARHLIEVAKSLCQAPLSKKQMQSAPLSPKSNGEPGGGGVIGAFNGFYEVGAILSRNGYQPRGNRYLAPDSTSGLPGVHIFEDTGRCYSHHANDPLNDGRHSHDAFSAFCILEHNNDVKAAVKAAAEMLGPDAPPFEPQAAPTKGDGADPQQAQEARGEVGEPEFTEAELLNFAKDGQVGDARLFIRLFKGKYCFDHAAGLWHEWAGHFWVEDEKNSVLMALDRIVDLYEKQALHCGWKKARATREDDKEAAKRAEFEESIFLKKIAQLQRENWRSDVLQFAAAGEDSLGITGREWDNNPLLIACPNGVLDLGSGGFRDGRPEDYIKTACPTEWRGLIEPAPEWKKFLNGVFDRDQELISYVQRLKGYALSGQRKERVLPLFTGIGWNGKGTLFETEKYTLGDLAGPVPAEILLEESRHNQKSGGAPTPEIMALRGKRIVWASETNEGKRLNAGKAKWLTGGDTLVGRSIYGKKMVSFAPTHTIFLITNQKPKANPDDYALWVRLHLVPFDFSFVDNPDPDKPHECQRDKELIEKLKKEASGILAWMVRGFNDWQKRGLDPPERVTQATESYRQDEDTVGKFIEERCILAPGAQIQASEFYQEYKKFCEDNGYKPIWGNKFGDRVGRRFEKEKTKKGVFYRGVGKLDN